MLDMMLSLSSGERREDAVGDTVASDIADPPAAPDLHEVDRQEQREGDGQHRDADRSPGCTIELKVRDLVRIEFCMQRNQRN